MEAIISSLITAGFALIGVVITCYFSNRRTKRDMMDEYHRSNENLKEEFRIAQAVTDTKIEELTREVREHNNFAKRMPVVENEIKHIENDIHRLQSYHN